MGLFILFEGCDGTGKTTQSKMFLEYLLKNNIKAELFAFPDRTSYTGEIIDGYLNHKIFLPAKTVHLLFSANRWEKDKIMKDLLNSGVTLIVDRYYYSGLAYSVSNGLDYEWCANTDKGQLRPDVVFYMKPREIYIGNEIYENIKFQSKVSSIFDRMSEVNGWNVIDSNLRREQIGSEINHIFFDTYNRINNFVMYK